MNSEIRRHIRGTVESLWTPETHESLQANYDFLQGYVEAAASYPSVQRDASKGDPGAELMLEEWQRWLNLIESQTPKQMVADLSCFRLCATTIACAPCRLNGTSSLEFFSFRNWKYRRWKYGR